MAGPCCRLPALPAHAQHAPVCPIATRPPLPCLPHPLLQVWVRPGDGPGGQVRPGHRQPALRQLRDAGGDSQHGGLGRRAGGRAGGCVGKSVGWWLFGWLCGESVGLAGPPPYKPRTSCSPPTPTPAPCRRATLCLPSPPPTAAKQTRLRARCRCPGATAATADAAAAAAGGGGAGCHRCCCPSCRRRCCHGGSHGYRADSGLQPGCCGTGSCQPDSCVMSLLPPTLPYPPTPGAAGTTRTRPTPSCGGTAWRRGPWVRV